METRDPEWPRVFLYILSLKGQTKVLHTTFINYSKAFAILNS